MFPFSLPCPFAAVRPGGEPVHERPHRQRREPKPTAPPVPHRARLVKRAGPSAATRTLRSGAASAENQSRGDEHERRVRRATGGNASADMTDTWSDRELEALMADLESDLVERKESLQGNAPRSIREAVCAFANDLPNRGSPGVVFVGVQDDGGPAGLGITDELLRQLADIKTDGNILPPPALLVAKHVLLGSEVAVVTVRPSDSTPVRYRGRIWIRVGPRRAIATAQDERILNEKRRHHDRHFDSQPLPTARMEDLDLRRFQEEYLPLAVGREVVEANDRSIEQRLAATKMVVSWEDTTPTIAGALVLGRRPQDFLPGAYVQFLRIAGTDWADPVADEALCDGPIESVVRRLDDKLLAHNRTAVDLTSGPRETRRSTFPHPALQQLARNAVMHRTYEGTNTPVRVYWFDDRIEIISPGGPYGTVSAELFGQPGIVDYRNPILAESMRVLGLVQRYGVGIPTARRELTANGQPEPEFRIEANWVYCTVRARP